MEYYSSVTDSEIFLNIPGFNISMISGRCFINASSFIFSLASLTGEPKYTVFPLSDFTTPDWPKTTAPFPYGQVFLYPHLSPQNHIVFNDYDTGNPHL